MTEDPTEQDWSLEYTTSVELMGNRNTDLDALSSAVATACVRCPEEWHGAFRTLLDEIEYRKLYMELVPPNYAS